LKYLTRPGVVALLACALAFGVHPEARLRALSSEAGATAIAALSLLLGCAYGARALRGGIAAQLMALGVLALLVGLAFDGARAHRGVLTLGLGQAKNNFEEQEADGRPLGLRPLGFDVQLLRATGSEAVLGLPQAGRQVAVLATRAARVGSYRLGDPRMEPTGEAARLTVTLSDASGSHPLELLGLEPARHGDLEVGLERYFPDFALDERQQPFTRSLHSRNPAALLRVSRGGKTFRVFVIRSMPGLHQVAELGQSFGLAAVEPEVLVRLRVAQEPFAPVVAAGALAVLFGVALGRSRA
jgi:hypothetical protein